MPRLRGGGNGPTVLLHLHATFSETELARRYDTVEAQRAHPRIARFVEWVRRKPPGFHSQSAGKGRRRR